MEECTHLSWASRRCFRLIADSVEEQKGQEQSLNNSQHTAGLPLTSFKACSNKNRTLSPEELHRKYGNKNSGFAQSVIRQKVDSEEVRKKLSQYCCAMLVYSYRELTDCISCLLAFLIFQTFEEIGVMQWFPNILLPWPSSAVVLNVAAPRIFLYLWGGFMVMLDRQPSLLASGNLWMVHTCKMEVAGIHWELLSWGILWSVEAFFTECALL